MPKQTYIKLKIQEIEKLASRGLTQEQIAASCGISRKTLYSKRKEIAEVQEAVDRGKAQGIKKMANKLFELGEAGNLGAIIFYLKTQGGWCEKQSINLESSDGSMTPKGDTVIDVSKLEPTERDRFIEKLYDRHD